MEKVYQLRFMKSQFQIERISSTHRNNQYRAGGSCQCEALKSLLIRFG